MEAGAPFCPASPSGNGVSSPPAPSLPKTFPPAALSSVCRAESSPCPPISTVRMSGRSPSSPLIFGIRRHPTSRRSAGRRTGVKNSGTPNPGREIIRLCNEAHPVERSACAVLGFQDSSSESHSKYNTPCRLVVCFHHAFSKRLELPCRNHL